MPTIGKIANAAKDLVGAIADNWANEYGVGTGIIGGGGGHKIK